MKAKTLSLSLCLAALAGTSTPSAAGGDWTDAGIKDYSTAVAVPAPIPVALYHPLWYFRVDAGMGFGDEVDASESGMLFGESFTDVGGVGYRAASPISADSSWLDASYTNGGVWNLGVGYYWNQNFRTDLTVESRRTQEVDIAGGATSLLESDAGGIGGVHPAASGDSYSVAVKDHTIVRGAVFMVNGYYDLAEYGPFKPYIGAGIGFGYTDLERKNESTISVIDNTVAGSAVPFSLSGNGSKDRQQETSLALAATVGFTYEVSEITNLDFGYRFLWVDGVHVELPVAGHNSNITIDDTAEHQIRAGLRFNVY